MKKFGFVSWYAIIASTIVTCLVDGSACLYIEHVGGFQTWQAHNPFWDVACAYLFMWHVFFAGVFWLVYICNKED